MSSFSRFHRRALEAADADDVARYFEHLVREREASASTCRVHYGAIRFLYEKVLERPAAIGKVVLPRRGQRLPELLNAGEIRSLVSATDNLKHRALLCTCYGCGLRVSELVRLRVRDVDGERRVLRVEQGKGGKDRDVALSEATLDQLRRYWSEYRPRGWLFPNDNTALERLRHPGRKKKVPRPSAPALPEGYRARGSPEAETAARA